ncbi:MAG: outer membrane beta-barrel protein, partial [Terriglobales bacterium]
MSRCSTPNNSRIQTGSKLLRSLIPITVILCFMCTVAFGQVTSGTIFGVVKDSSGAVIPGATITAQDPATGATRNAVTGDAGNFVLPNLLPGTYSISVEAKGFKKLTKSGVVLSAADRLNSGEFKMEPGASDTSMTVTAEAAELQLQTNSGERSDIITSKQLNDVAMNGRNVLDYMKLVPGSTGTFDGHMSGTGGIDSFNINGTRANQHEFTIDGASNVDTGNNGGTHVTLNTDAIEEVKILTSNYQAEFGKAAGGQVALITKSGTNAWHGNGRFFHRNEGMNANEWFNKADQLSSPTPHNDPKIYRYNDAGYQLGGPILKNKIFAFWSQEFFEQLVPIGSTTQFYTPTQAERNGDFSQSTDEMGAPVVITGPGITGNKIDRSQLSAQQQAVFDQVQKILNLYPMPNVSGFATNGQNYNYSQSLSGEAPRREDILRVDWQITNKERLFGRWINNAEDDSSPFVPFPGPYGVFSCSSVVNFPGGCTQHHPGWNVSVNLVSTITPTILNEFSVGPSHTLSFSDGTNGNISRGKNGIDMALLFPVGSDQAIPDMSFGGLGNVGFQGGYLGATPWKQANTTINVNDNLTWVRNTHTFKAGMFYQRNRKDQIAWGNINGQFSFS